MRYRLRTRRERLGLTQAEVAARAGLHQTDISQAELGKFGIMHRNRGSGGAARAVRKIRNVLCNAECERHEERKRARVERERRALGAQIPEHIRAAMLQRAYDLLWDHNCGGCDALLEFLPEAEVTEMLAAWDSDQADESPKSRWY